MRKTFAVITIVAAAAGTTGLATAAYAAGTDTGREMHERMSVEAPMDMGSMDMGSMDMGSIDMDAMHEQMRGAMPAELRDACDEVHRSMGGAMPGAAHDAHHPER